MAPRLSPSSCDSFIEFPQASTASGERARRSAWRGHLGQAAGPTGLITFWLWRALGSSETQLSTRSPDGAVQSRLGRCEHGHGAPVAGTARSLDGHGKPGGHGAHVGLSRRARRSRRVQRRACRARRSRQARRARLLRRARRRA